MNALFAFFEAHQVMATIVAYWVISGAISTMPPPTKTGGGYRWFYDFSHFLMGNLKQLYERRFGSNEVKSDSPVSPR